MSSFEAFEVYKADLLLSALFFVAGVVMIGLFVLKKYHCEKEGTFALCKYLKTFRTYYWTLIIISAVIDALIYISVEAYLRVQTKHYYEKTKNHPKVYIYDTFMGKPIESLVISANYDLPFLIQYQKEVDSVKRQLILSINDKTDTIKKTFEFPPLDFNNRYWIFVRSKKPVGYFAGYKDKDSLIGIVAVFDTIRWRYINYYVHKNNIHFNPPPENIEAHEPK